jgi:hypothetical protein
MGLAACVERWIRNCSQYLPALTDKQSHGYGILNQAFERLVRAMRLAQALSYLSEYPKMEWQIPDNYVNQAMQVVEAAILGYRGLIQSRSLIENFRPRLILEQAIASCAWWFSVLDTCSIRARYAPQIGQQFYQSPKQLCRRHRLAQQRQTTGQESLLRSSSLASEKSSWIWLSLYSALRSKAGLKQIP